ncbi:MAG: 50S ribosomal protein L4 [Desulfarculaceae bacterium]|nr:50S ribosomal protein L4 [Desulfarculaceae bacterium]MCF8048109.1 50S ribosomal protein L4 [Desulfarculaceae bacterium]MCF8064095.1 50S ribosomal protein L4 [Desulfarculaceae bacterium]MCF8099995.1 50S ribosomal protein L4 [Desulfarculaceae bacterium]MCF8122577.1 50S ribosomal protein L4 [Desulfarculaceae bacterium]
MPTLDVLDRNNQKVGQVELSEAVFGAEVKPHLLHEVVVWQLAKRRAGTASTKIRKEVRGGGHKPWRQKGTGRARSGSRRNPLWRGGGTIFGPKPRDYNYSVPKKVKKAALRSALSSKLGEEKLTVLRGFDLESIKTKDFVAVLSNLAAANCLVVIPSADEMVEKSGRNVARVKVLRAEGLNVYDILKHDRLLLLEGAVAGIEEALS